MRGAPGGGGFYPTGPPAPDDVEGDIPSSPGFVDRVTVAGSVPSYALPKCDADEVGSETLARELDSARDNPAWRCNPSGAWACRCSVHMFNKDPLALIALAKTCDDTPIGTGEESMARAAPRAKLSHLGTHHNRRRSTIANRSAEVDIASGATAPASEPELSSGSALRAARVGATSGKSAEASRNFACEQALRSLINGAWLDSGETPCVDAMMRVTQRSKNWLYHAAGESPSRAVRCGVSTAADRLAVTADDLSRLAATLCCEKRCLRNVGPPQLRSFRVAWGAKPKMSATATQRGAVATIGQSRAKGAQATASAPSKTTAQNALLRTILWSTRRGCLEGFCQASICTWFNTSPGRVRRVERALVDSGGVDLPVHGLVGSTPANVASATYRDMIWAFVEYTTRSDPEKAILRVTHPVYVSLRRFYDGFIEEMCLERSSLAAAGLDVKLDAFEEAKEKSYTTFKKYLVVALKKEGLKLLGVAYDHNKCPRCKDGEMADLVVDRSIKKLNAEIALGKLAATPAQIAALADLKKAGRRNHDLLLEHLRNDMVQRAYVKRWQSCAKILARCSLKRGIDCEAQIYPWCSNSNVVMFHTDDRSAPQFPSFPLDVGHEGQAKYKVSLAGMCRLDNNRMTSIYSDAGDQSKKDAAGVLEEVLLELLRQINGEKAGVFVFDCGPLNHCATIALLLGQLLVDIGALESAVCIFYEQRHSKGPADRRFGTMINLERTQTILSIDDQARVATLVKNSEGVHDDAIILNILSRINLRAHLAARYPDILATAEGRGGATFKALNFKALDPHVTVATNAVAFAAMDAPALMGALIAGGAPLALVAEVMTPDLEALPCVAALPFTAPDRSATILEHIKVLTLAATAAFQDLLLRRLLRPLLAPPGVAPAPQSGVLNVMHRPPSLATQDTQRVLVLAHGATARAAVVPPRRVEVEAGKMLNSVLEVNGYNCWKLRRVIQSDLSMRGTYPWPADYKGLVEGRKAAAINWIARQPAKVDDAAEYPNLSLILAANQLPSDFIPVNSTNAHNNIEFIRNGAAIPVVAPSIERPYASASAALRVLDVPGRRGQTRLDTPVSSWSALVAAWPALATPSLAATAAQIADQRVRSRAQTAAHKARAPSAQSATAYREWLSCSERPALVQHAQDSAARAGTPITVRAAASRAWAQLKDTQEDPYLRLVNTAARKRAQRTTAAENAVLARRAERLHGFDAGATMYACVWNALFVAPGHARPWSRAPSSRDS